jgi:alanine racemase
MQATIAEIDLSAFKFNIEQIKKRVAPAKIMAIVKANGYGHGAVPLAHASIQAGAEYLAVALVEEGIELRENGITAPILVFSGLQEEQIDQFLDYDLEMTVYTESMARQISDRAQWWSQPARIHVKVDTGMGRVGVVPENSVELIQKIRQLSDIEIVGLYTHFATSDEKDKTYANFQLNRFKKVIAELEKKGINIPLKHAANSGAILDMPDTFFDMVRPGIMTYGWYPTDETSESVPVKPVMTFKTRVLYIKKIQSGESVSYGRKFIAARPTLVATLSVGYADGYNRLLSNRGEVLIRGKKFPVIGRVCMDLIHVDLGNDNEIQVGDEVVLFGSQGGAKVSVNEICQKLDTIPYEVCCWISDRVVRVYREE